MEKQKFGISFPKNEEELCKNMENLYNILDLMKEEEIGLCEDRVNNHAHYEIIDALLSTIDRFDVCGLEAITLLLVASSCYVPAVDCYNK